MMTPTSEARNRGFTLLELLVDELERRFADDANVPPFTIFSDATLHDYWNLLHATGHLWPVGSQPWPHAWPSLPPPWNWKRPRRAGAPFSAPSTKGWSAPIRPK